MELKCKVSEIKGIGKKKEEALEKLNIREIEDFLYFYPRSYQDRRNIVKIQDLEPGVDSLVRAKVTLIVADKYHYKKKNILRLLVEDDSSPMEVVFFNAQYLSNAFQKDVEYDFFGKTINQMGRRQMIHPEFIKTSAVTGNGILPVYPLTAGISQNEMRKWQGQLQPLAEELEEYMPEQVIERNRLCSLQYAINNIHFPDTPFKLKAAKFRLVFDELFTLQMGLIMLKNSFKDKANGIAFEKSIDVNDYISTLSFSPTNAQKRVIGQVIGDMESPNVMNRLIQGDVGSGKTMVAEVALYKAIKSGYQGVLMAPTELLARQHYDGIKERFAAHGITTGFLSGSAKAKEKAETLAGLAEGSINVLIGTHAVIQDGVEFQNLGLVITDEQHRFGVNQRMLLGQKGKNPDTIVMTATPIPRTLAVILYGDLDISIIDELPPGRRAILTRATDESRREKAYTFLLSEIQNGRQAYVVAPLIDDSESIQARSAESLFEELIGKFSEYNVALLHGEMKQKEKDEIMAAFYDGRIDILVSTVVIEVGINVPNATIMIIENAERFGLAQLHQLRGRVGRGTEQSYCILITEGDKEIAKKRAQIMVSTTDGFLIAEKDLELRGPGEFFGTRQHGIPDLKLADLVKHLNILNDVKEETRQLLSEDPFLENAENQRLKEKVRKMFGQNSTIGL